MMRVHLYPPPSLPIPVVNVVSERLLLTASHVGPFIPKTCVLPIFIKCHRVCDLHGIDDIALSSTGFGARPDYPVADHSGLAYSGLAGCQRAVAVEGIRCETVVSRDNVRMQSQKFILPNMSIA